MPMFVSPQRAAALFASGLEADQVAAELARFDGKAEPYDTHAVRAAICFALGVEADRLTARAGIEIDVMAAMAVEGRSGFT